jgi:uncharacterized protein
MHATMVRVLAVVGITMFMAAPALSQAEAPWGKAVVEAIDYAPQRVVYDVAEGDLERFDRILDRVSF